MPPWPGSRLPLSLTPMSRFSAEMVTSPMKPPTPMISPAAMAMGHSMGVSTGASSTASTVVVATPPRKPSQVLLGLTLGTTLRRPSIFPHRYWQTSLNWVRKTRYSTSPAPPATGLPAAGSTSRKATWLMLKTMVISPQCRVPTARRKDFVSPMRIMRMGRNKNMNTGMKMMNMPYQPVAIQ